MLATNYCQPDPTGVSINDSLMPEKKENGEEGGTWSGVEDHPLVSVRVRKAVSL